MTPQSIKHLLAICTYPPGQQLKNREALDAILATAAFGQTVKVLFCGDGVWQLLEEQGDYTGNDKPLGKSLCALPLYEVSEVYADRQSLEERGLSREDLLSIVEVIDSDAALGLMRECQGLLSF